MENYDYKEKCKMENYDYRDTAKNVYRLLGLETHQQVEIIVKGNDVIVHRAMTNAEKRSEWVNAILSTIPKAVRFVRDGNVTIAYQQYNGVKKSAFAVCDPTDEYDERLGKCIAFFRLCGWITPDYVLED